ncbi:MAG: hypothetical protein F4X12_13955 [Acidobacteriia bacterium]|nr:hypothetical protein [Terriglobia bacterium]
MTHAAGLWPENAALRERLPALSSAIPRISASLELDTVLAEVVQSACAEVLADLPGGADVGNLFLAEEADGEEFTGDDEEVVARPNRQRRRGGLVEANWQG